jgi:hypothetical protein
MVRVNLFAQTHHPVRGLLRAHWHRVQQKKSCEYHGGVNTF